MNPELLDELEAQFAPANHEVFQLTPPEFDRWASTYYTQMGKPLVTHDTFWDVYRGLLAHFMQVPDVEQDLHIPLSLHGETERRINEEELPLMIGQQPLRMVEMHPSNGELNGPETAGPSTIPSTITQTAPNVYGCREYVHFTSSEDESEGDDDREEGDEVQ